VVPKAADRGRTFAQTALGAMYASGRGVRRTRHCCFWEEPTMRRSSAPEGPMIRIAISPAAYEALIASSGKGGFGSSTKAPPAGRPV
jgi:TPR repeat protein